MRGLALNTVCQEKMTLGGVNFKQRINYPNFRKNQQK